MVFETVHELLNAMSPSGERQGRFTMNYFYIRPFANGTMAQVVLLARMWDLDIVEWLPESGWIKRHGRIVFTGRERDAFMFFTEVFERHLCG